MIKTIELEIYKRGYDLNFYYAMPMRGFEVYRLPRSADFYFDQLRLGERVLCTVEHPTMVVLSVNRPEHDKLVEKLVGEEKESHSYSPIS